MKFPAGWQEILEPVKKEPFFKTLLQFLDDEYKKGKVIYPERKNLFKALEYLDYHQVKVVILGQDPYHGPGQAMGLSFAVPNDLLPKPPSLQNIFKELQSDIGVTIPKGLSDLSGWAKQGVLLINTVLTVEANIPLSHRNRGWEQFTHHMILELNARKEPMVFILWGSHAQKFREQIDLSRHVVIESAHPSPLSAHRGFFGSRVFSRTNESLKKLGHKPIQWEKLVIF